MSKSKLLAGILIGAAVGTVLGILLAPDKGAETRKKLSQKKDKMRENLMNKFGEVKESIKEKYDSIRKEANEILEKENEAKRNFGQKNEALNKPCQNKKLFNGTAK